MCPVLQKTREDASTWQCGGRHEWNPDICLTTTAGEDETSEGNPENSKRDAFDVAPSVPAPEDEAAAVQ